VLPLTASAILNGLAFSMLLFIMAAGLSLIFGFMNVLNFAHGSFFMVGAYVGLSVVQITGSFWLAVLVAAIVVAVLGLVVERLLLARMYRKRHIDQAIMTIGLSYMIADVVQTIWGTQIQSIDPPHPLDGVFDLLGRPFPTYRVAVIIFGLIIAVALWSAISHTRIGAIIRAGTTDREMVSGLGINVGLVFTLVLATGVGLAGAGGVLGAPILGVYQGMDVDTFIRTLVVVVVGGLGTLEGAFVGALLIGMMQTIGITLFPQLASVISYALMALVLLLRPAGLLGRRPA
jgi:branched-chain amino acid transport system permease protein